MQPNGEWRWNSSAAPARACCRYTVISESFEQIAHLAARRACADRKFRVDQSLQRAYALTQETRGRDEAAGMLSTLEEPMGPQSRQMGYSVRN